MNRAQSIVRDSALNMPAGEEHFLCFPVETIHAVAHIPLYTIGLAGNLLSSLSEILATRAALFFMFCPMDELVLTRDVNFAMLLIALYDYPLLTDDILYIIKQVVLRERLPIYQNSVNTHLLTAAAFLRNVLDFCAKESTDYRSAHGAQHVEAAAVINRVDALIEIFRSEWKKRREITGGSG